MKVALVTGGTKGIGFQISLNLLRNNYYVIITARSLNKKTENILKSIGGNRFSFHKVDFTDLKSVVRFCKRLKLKKKLSLLIANAGINKFSSNSITTKDNLEIHMSTNHCANYIITEKLNRYMDANTKIIIFSSDLHKGMDIDSKKWLENHKTYGSYGISKFANICHAKYLGSKYKTLAYHPGFVRTSMNKFDIITPSLEYSIFALIFLTIFTKNNIFLIILIVVSIIYFIIMNITISPYEVANNLKQLIDSDYKSGSYYEKDNLVNDKIAHKKAIEVCEATNYLLMKQMNFL